MILEKGSGISDRGPGGTRKHPRPSRVVGTVDVADGLLSFSRAGEHLPTINGETITHLRLSSWRRCGLLSASGERIGLRAVKLNGGWHTTRQAVIEFLNEVTKTPAQSPRVAFAPGARQMLIAPDLRARAERLGLRIGGHVDRIA